MGKVSRKYMTSMTSTVPQALPRKEIVQIMVGLMAALFTALLSTTIVSTALPTIMAELDGTQREYTWVITASLLMMTIGTPIWGKFADLFNKKLLVQLAILLFIVSSLIAGFAHSIPVMIGARVIQGVSMGGLMALVQAIIGAIVSPRERGKYSGYMAGVMGLATVSGPLLGGVITDELGWRWTYFICIPLAVAAFLVIQLKLTIPANPPRKITVDYTGGVLIALTAALPMLWVTFAGSSFDWVSWESAAFVGGFVLTGLLAVVVELRAKEPIVPIRLLSNSTAALMIVASLAVGVAMFGPAVFLTQYFQLGKGYSATEAGLMILPMVISQTLSSMIAGIVVTNTGRWKPVMLVGSILMVTGLAGLGYIDASSAYWWVAVSMAVTGFGVGALIQNIVLAVQNTVDVTDVGAASATIAFFRSLGGAIGVTALGALLTNQVTQQIQERATALGDTANGAAELGGDETSLDLSDLPQQAQELVQRSYAEGFGHVFLIAAIISVIALIAVAVVREIPLRTSVVIEPKAPVEPTVIGGRTDGGESAEYQGSECSQVQTHMPDGYSEREK